MNRRSLGEDAWFRSWHERCVSWRRMGGHLRLAGELVGQNGFVRAVRGRVTEFRDRSTLGNHKVHQRRAYPSRVMDSEWTFGRRLAFGKVGWITL